MTTAKATHTGYTLIPIWIRGFPGWYFSLALSKSSAQHVSSSPSASIVVQAPRYGLTVKVCGRVAAFYVEGRGRVVSSLEMALAEGEA